MTKLEVKIKKKEVEAEEMDRKGAYLATFNQPDDRIIFFNDLFQNRDMVTVIDKLFLGEFHIQENQMASIYTNLKKIKKITIEVELE